MKNNDHKPLKIKPTIDYWMMVRLILLLIVFSAIYGFITGRMTFGKGAFYVFGLTAFFVALIFETIELFFIVLRAIVRLPCWVFYHFPMKIYTATKWEILTEPNAQTIYFAPKRWSEWNNTGDKEPRHLRGRRFVFELAPRSRGYTLIFRGQALENPSVFPLLQAPEFIVQDQNNHAKNTCRYMHWFDNSGFVEDREITMPLVKTLDRRPAFSSNKELLTWIESWVEMVDQILGYKGAFSKWLKNVNECGRQYKFSE